MIVDLPGRCHVTVAARGSSTVYPQIIGTRGSRCAHVETLATEFSQMVLTLVFEQVSHEPKGATVGRREETQNTKLN
jgi:hypothetical protein